MEEIWKDIPGYEGLYQVSDFGNVKSLSDRWGKERLMKPSTNKRGYLQLVLCKQDNRKTIRVHQLVAMAFLGHVPCGMNLIVDHYPDKTKTNNNLRNLRLATQRENCSSRGGSSKYVGVRLCSITNKWRAHININRKFKHLGSFINEIDAHNEYQKALKDSQK